MKVCLRKILRLHPRTRSYLLPALCNSLNAKTEIEKRMLTFYIQGINHCSNNMKSYFFNCLTERCSTMFTNINILLRQNNILYSLFILLIYKKVFLFIMVFICTFPEKKNFVSEMLFLHSVDYTGSSI